MSAVLPAPEPTTEPITLPVRCRPDQSNWGLIVFVDVIFALFLWTLCSSPRGTGTSPADLWLLGIMAALILVPSFLSALWLIRATIVADELGLRWRGMGCWHSSSWTQITDYYDQMITGKKTGPLSIVEFGTKRLKLTNGFWKKADLARLKSAVVECAADARPIEWGVRGTRQDLDFPRVFRYDTKDNRTQAVFFFSMLICLIIMLGVIIIPKVLSTVATMGWGWGLATLGMFTFLLLPKGLYLGLSVSVWRATRRRFGEQIVISRDGLHFTSPKRQLKVSWHEITDYYIAPRKMRELAAHYCVVTSQGSFDFISSIQEASVLIRILHQQSPLGTEKKWAYQRDEEALGGPGAKWSSGCAGVGERVYHYRTRANRAVLWIPTVFSLATCLQPLMALAGWLTLKGSIQAPFMVSLLLGVLAFWGWYRYFTASIQISGAGITQFAPFRKKHIAWGQIEKFYQSGDDAFVFGNVVGLGMKIRFWLGISDVEELKEEIARRAVNAVGAWQGITDDTQLGTCARDGSNLAGKSGSTRSEPDRISVGSRYGR